MSHNQHTTHEQQFEARLLEMEPYLANWARARIDVDDMTRDEALQRTRITLWEQFQKDPEGWLAKSPRTWTQFAKTVYRHSVYDKKERVINRRFVQGSDIESEQVREGDTSGIDLVRSKPGHRKSSDQAFYLAELRIDLNAAIQAGMREVDIFERADMRKLMSGIAEGYTRLELRRRHGWTRAYEKHLYHTLQTTFYTALTGETRDSIPTREEPAPTAAELERLERLEARGLGGPTIARAMGHSQGWADRELRKLRDKKVEIAAAQKADEPVDDLVRFAMLLGGVMVNDPIPAEGRDTHVAREGADRRAERESDGRQRREAPAEAGGD